MTCTSMAGVRLPRLVGVLGAGQLGSGIAQVCALKGQDVVLCDTSQDALDASIASIRRRLESQVKKHKLSREEANTAFGRLRPTSIVEVDPPLLTAASSVFASDPPVGPYLPSALYVNGSKGGLAGLSGPGSSGPCNRGGAREGGFEEDNVCSS